MHRINTSLTDEEYEEIKEKQYKINDLIRLGKLSKENNPQLIDRISSIERKYERINYLLEEIYKKLK